MANGTLHAGGGGAVFFCNGGVEHLCHRIDDVAILNGQQNGGAEVLIPLDVGGNTDLMDDLGIFGDIPQSNQFSLFDGVIA